MACEYICETEVEKTFYDFHLDCEILDFNDKTTRELDWFRTSRYLFEIVRETKATYLLKLWELEKDYKDGDKYYLKLVETSNYKRIYKKKLTKELKEYEVDLSLPFWYSEKAYMIDLMSH